MSEAADTAAVLFANDAFYVAFQSADADAMERVWAARDGISCLHPGWPPLIGRRMVIQSWRGILSNTNQSTVTAHGAHAELHGDTAVVVCYETVGGFTLVATNVFVREDGGWRMVHHQSGETQMPQGGIPANEDRGRLQ
jgi:ketosteroid isomerase-like protein